MQKLKGLGKQFFHIDTYIDEKTSRIIKEIVKKSIELPTVEQAKLYIQN